MKKTLSLILLFIFSFASAQSKDKEVIASKPIVSLKQIFLKMESLPLGNEIKNALPSGVITLDSNNAEELKNYLSTEALFFGKKTVAFKKNPITVSDVILTYNDTNSTLSIEISRALDGKKITYKRFTYNYQTNR